MASLKEFTGTPAEKAAMEAEARNSKTKQQAQMDAVNTAKQAEWAKRPAPSTKLSAPVGSTSGKSMKGFKPSTASKALSRTGTSAASQANATQVKARLDAMRKMAGK